MKGSVRKRCQCRDDQGRRVTSCRKKHGSWSFTIEAGYDVAGKRKQLMRSGFRTQDQAEEAMTKELAALAAGTWTDDQGIRLGDWLDQWLASFGKRVGSQQRSPKTLAVYRSHVVNFWKPQLGHMLLRELRRGHVEQALARLGQRQTAGRREGNSGSYREQRSPGTIDSYRRTLRTALSAACRRELLGTNPAEGRMDAIPDRGRKKQLRLWEPEETARLLDYVTGERLATLYELAAYAGLRRAELCGLRWRDIDPDGAGLQIAQTVVDLSRGQAGAVQLTCPSCGREHPGRYFKSPKSEAGERWVPLARPAQAALEAHRRSQVEERAMFGADYREHDLVFCYVDGDPLRPDAVTREFNAHAAACELPPIRLHDMRHGACSLLLSAGVPIEVVQMILGHSSPAVTRQVYAHLMRGATAEQLEAGTQRLTKHRREQSVSNWAESDESAASA